MLGMGVHHLMTARSSLWPICNVVSALAGVMLISASAAATDYYVAPNGSDGNDGSKTAPWATLGPANAELHPGDTVFLRDGEYAGIAIRPDRSGKPGQPIRYVAYAGETAVITDVPKSAPYGSIAIVLDNRDHIVIDGLTVDGKDVFDKSNLKLWASLENARYNELRNCTFRYARGSDAISIRGNSDHNQLVGNTMSYVGTWDKGNGQDSGNMLTLGCGATQNLIEANELRYSGHTPLRVRAHRNIIRGNLIENDWTESNGNRGAAITGDKDCSTLGRNLFEGNIIARALDPIDAEDSAAIKVESLNQIVRRNVIMASQSGISTVSRANTGPATGNRIFHNVVFAVDHYGWRTKQETGLDHDDNELKNNIFFRTQQLATAEGDLATTLALNAPLKTNRVAFNLLVKDTPGDATIKTPPEETGSVQDKEASFPDNFFGNIEKLPTFIVATPQAMDDFRPAASSAVIDAGDFLTRTIAAGSGTEVVVVDAGYFCDGFGVVAGDLIQIGDQAGVQITQVDYATNTITLAESRQWSEGDGVSLPFNGDAPDVGAFEFAAGGAGGSAGSGGAAGSGGSTAGAGGMAGGSTGGGKATPSPEDASACCPARSARTGRGGPFWLPSCWPRGGAAASP